MIKHEKAIETLRHNGHRLTPQRLIVLSTIASGDGHMGVDEVFQVAKESYPYMDIATVYRTLHLFKDLGVVTEVAIDDRLHFELTDLDGHHHHMVCRACNGAFNLSPHYLAEFRNTLNKEFGFEPDLEHFAVSGVCAKCQEADAKTTWKQA
ncbi:MAG: transcriptional repressor [SAR202 cluster bacterium]|jgi:Fe2+ or Zn2+ uptake regulation protein|nr:Fur family transcriptional regulator [Dehalococcoidia bacterium]MQF88564.1 transcriptional repressor [SAR202 cluster bacterium]|tara:strand:- start:143 stop:595 length:453 start_codon:yes stop_codon:yes gene_type:complete